MPEEKPKTKNNHNMIIAGGIGLLTGIVLRMWNIVDDYNVLWIWNVKMFQCVFVLNFMMLLPF